MKIFVDRFIPVLISPQNSKTYANNRPIKTVKEVKRAISVRLLFVSH